MLTESNFPHILHAVIDISEPITVFRVGQVCQHWRRVVKDRFYHLKAHYTARFGNVECVLRPRASPSIMFAVQRANEDKLYQMRHCRVLDFEDKAGNALLSSSILPAGEIHPWLVFAQVHTVRLFCWAKVSYFSINIPRVVVPQGHRLESTPVSPRRRSKVVTLLQGCWPEDTYNLLWREAVGSLVLLFRPYDTAPIAPTPSSGSVDASPLLDIPEGLKYLLSILCTAHFTHVKVIVVNAESVYLPPSHRGTGQTVRDLLERCKATTDFATRLRLTNAPFSFLTLEEYRSSIGEHEFAIETERGYVSM